MRKIFFLLTILSMLAIAFCSDDPERWAPGMVLIELEETTFGDPIIGDNGYVITGFPEVDLACVDIGIIKWARIIPIAPNPEYRRRWRWTERWFKFYFDPDKTDVPTAVERLRSAQGVKYVEPNYRWKLLLTPNDPYYYGHQWYVRQINANRVWDFTQGSPTIIMSGVDSGVDYLHPDLTNLIWQNLGEDADRDGRVFIPHVGFDPGDIDSIDNDGNGYIDDFIGYDFVDGAWGDAYRHPDSASIREDGYDPDNDPNDFRYNGHGTHCTGVMTAQGNNRIGIAGLTWHTRILCLRAGYYSRSCNGYNQSDAVVAGLQYSLNKGCRIFNFSYGGNDSSHFVHAMIDTAVREWGVIITAAAGNDDTDRLHYPSAYPEVIAVAATDMSDCKSDFSNYNSTVDISAPGVAIGSTVPRFYSSPPYPCNMGFSPNFAPGYADFSGTSMAAPVVAGSAALLWSFYPDSSNTWIRNRLLNNVINIYSLSCNSSFFPGRQLGSGRVDALRAFASGIFPMITLESVTAIDAGGDGRFDPGENVTLTIAFSNTSEPIWANAIGTSVSIRTADSLVVITDSIGYIGNINLGETRSNSSDPIVFHMNPAFTYGRKVNFVVTLRGTGGYTYISEFSLKVGYPEVLIMSQDTTQLYMSKVAGAFRWGGVEYDTMFLPITPVTPTRLSKHRIVLLLSGKARGASILPTTLENSLSSWLSASSDRMLVLSGQDLPEAADSAWLARYFSAVHMVDSLPVSYGMYIFGKAGDTLGRGIASANIAFGGGSAGNQRSFGSCKAIGTGIPFLYYNYGTLPDSTCAVRYQDPIGYKSVLFEFGLEGLGDSLRYVMVQRLMNWAGIQYFWDVPEVAQKPRFLELEPPYPNPFNSSVALGFRIPESAPVNIDIFDISGRLIRSMKIPEAPEGLNIVRWDAKKETGEKLPTGTYLYRVSSCGLTLTGKIVYIK